MSASSQVKNIDDLYSKHLEDLITAIRNVEGGKEYVKIFNDKDGFVNNTSNPIQAAITDEWSKTSLEEQTRCTYGCLFRMAQQYFREEV
jgi:hypothetical protein